MFSNSEYHEVVEERDELKAALRGVVAVNIALNDFVDRYLWAVAREEETDYEALGYEETEAGSGDLEQARAIADGLCSAYSLLALSGAANLFAKGY